MSQICKDRCIGQIISSTISLNGIPIKVEDQKAILEYLPSAIETAEKLAEKEQARKGSGSDPVLQNSNSQQREDELASASPEERADIIDNAVVCSVSCCCNKNPKSGSGDQELKQQCVEEVLK